ncbi:hypothetical protein J7J23_00045 [bacterium]|nr:hypothetical protein [bacterium]
MKKMVGIGLVLVLFLFSTELFAQEGICWTRIINGLQSPVSVKIDWHKEIVLAPELEFECYLKPGMHTILIKELYPAGYNTKATRKHIKRVFYIDQEREKLVWRICKDNFIPTY